MEAFINKLGFWGFGVAVLMNGLSLLRGILHQNFPLMDLGIRGVGGRLDGEIKALYGLHDPGEIESRAS